MAKKNSKTPGFSPPYTAATADRHHLYQESVQDSEITIDLIDAVYRHGRGRRPLSLREDFCGTGLLAADWVRSHRSRTAVGLDIDGATLDWGREHNVEPLGRRASRVQLLKRDVLSRTAPSGFDVVAAFNFSYWAFHDRATLKRYFQGARRALADGGMFMLDLHGGPDSQFQLEEATELDGFDYVWDQDLFDPINNHTICHIHFRFPDGSELRRAFSYDWRVWSMPELRDLLLEAGFTSVQPWWEGEDDRLRPTDEAESLEAWVAYLAAWK